jgi:hypothetical protein
MFLLSLSYSRDVVIYLLSDRYLRENYIIVKYSSKVRLELSKIENKEALRNTKYSKDEVVHVTRPLQF